MSEIPLEKIQQQIRYWRSGADENLSAASEIIQKTERFGVGLYFCI